MIDGSTRGPLEHRMYVCCITFECEQFSISIRPGKGFSFKCFVLKIERKGLNISNLPRYHSRRTRCTQTGIYLAVLPITYAPFFSLTSLRQIAASSLKAQNRHCHYPSHRPTEKKHVYKLMGITVI